MNTICSINTKFLEELIRIEPYIHTMRPQFDIYATSGGVKQFSNPTKRDILARLQGGALTLTQLRRITGRAHSTLSVHMQDLIEEGLVASRPHPKDGRSKVFYLTAKPIGTTTFPEEQFRSTIKTRVKDSLNDTPSFLRIMLKAVRYGIESTGINIDPLLRDVGRLVGTEVGAQALSTGEVEQVLLEASRFWKVHELGKMRIEQTDPLVIVVEECFDCGGMPEIGKTLCALEEGMLEGVLLARAHRRTRVVETECFGTGYTHCKFVVDTTNTTV